jgi:hypothetical protein
VTQGIGILGSGRTGVGRFHDRRRSDSVSLGARKLDERGRRLFAAAGVRTAGLWWCRRSPGWRAPRSTAGWTTWTPRRCRRGRFAALAAGRNAVSEKDPGLIPELGKDAAGLSVSAIGRLKDGWQDEHAAWARRDLSAKRYVYVWADGIHLEARLEDEKQCILVLIGATADGKKELVGFTTGRGKARRTGAICCSISSGAGLPSPPSSASPTARSASGRRRARCGPRQASSAAGCTRPRTS